MIENTIREVSLAPFYILDDFLVCMIFRNLAEDAKTPRERALLDKNGRLRAQVSQQADAIASLQRELEKQSRQSQLRYEELDKYWREKVRELERQLSLERSQHSN